MQNFASSVLSSARLSRSPNLSETVGSFHLPAACLTWQPATYGFLWSQQGVQVGDTLCFLLHTIRDTGSLLWMRPAPTCTSNSRICSNLRWTRFVQYEQHVVPWCHAWVFSELLISNLLFVKLDQIGTRRDTWWESFGSCDDQELAWSLQGVFFVSFCHWQAALFFFQELKQLQQLFKEWCVLQKNQSRKAGAAAEPWEYLLKAQGAR